MTDKLLDKTRELLTEQKVKLWLPPFTLENGERGEDPQAIADVFSKQLGCTKHTMLECLETLRLHAVEKLRAKACFQENGIASLKIKLAGSLPSHITDKSFTIATTLHATGTSLKEMLHEKCKLETKSLKLISSGRVINDEQILSEQGLTNFTQVLCICLSMSEVKAREDEDEARHVRDAKAAAQLLVNNFGGDDEGGEYHVNITDQRGQPLHLPIEERKALTLALTLNEKGRSALKRKDYGLALTLLLEADREFSVCRSSILEKVDNYSILCLDIVWCYLCLKNVEMLPDAESRLKTCEQGFNTCYGANMERLDTWNTGGRGAELALYVRLHLLQGIVAYYKQDYYRARERIGLAEYELKRLKVDDDKLTHVMNMGFTSSEARIGLRKSDGDLERAITLIMEIRDERDKEKKRLHQEKKQRHLQDKLGKTTAGEDVRVDLYQQLISMGYDHDTAKRSLHVSDNNLDRALHIVEYQPELLVNANASGSNESSSGTGSGGQGGRRDISLFISQLQSQLQQFGIHLPDPSVVMEALGNNPTPEQFQTFLGTLGGPMSSLSSQQLQNIIQQYKNISRQEKNSRLTEEELKTVDELMKDINPNVDDYLDIVLEEEEYLISEYRAMLNSCQGSGTSTD